MPSAITLAGSSGPLQSFTYADAPAGNIMTETDGPGPQTPASYGYDPGGRVTQMTPAGGTATDDYGFDASGNLTTLPTGAAASYGNAGQLTSSSLSGTTTSYAYSADGERLSAAQGSTTIATGSWNGAGQLTAYSTASEAMSAAEYDGDGMRTSAAFTPSGGQAATQDYLWDGDDLLMDSVNAYIYAVGNAPTEQVSLSTGAITYLSADSLGSVRGVISSSGALTGTASYDAWGNPGSAGGLTAATPFGYASGYTDPDGLIYLLNRYYDPATGQFTSVDPELAQTLQPYAYTGGDPVSETDPTGLATVNLRGVASWAAANVTSWPSEFPDDCTAFTSNALYHGGGDPMTEGIFADETNDHYWWYQTYQFPHGYARTWSHSWSVAYDLGEHQLIIGSRFIKYWNEARPGDIIFASWNGDIWERERPNGQGIDHDGVIIRMQDGAPVIAQHTINRVDTLAFWLHNGGPDVHVWVFQPNAG